MPSATRARKREVRVEVAQAFVVLSFVTAVVVSHANSHSLAAGPRKIFLPSVAKPRQEGIAYASWWQGEYSHPDSDLSLASLRATGADWISLFVGGTKIPIIPPPFTPTSPRLPMKISRMPSPRLTSCA
ncbi:MAG: hypothetical protein AMJ93_08400 [Anaerolineae bacterium SM23_84]|nr:MAG: hypothetical protein AMJ93_08400 [Anaerolineae bacterium SM23_84]